MSMGGFRIVFPVGDDAGITGEAAVMGRKRKKTTHKLGRLRFTLLLQVGSSVLSTQEKRP